MKIPPKIFFLLSCLIIGFIFLAPQHNFQQQLAQGDHGRDLYCFQKTFDALNSRACYQSFKSGQFII